MNPRSTISMAASLMTSSHTMCSFCPVFRIIFFIRFLVGAQYTLNVAQAWRVCGRRAECRPSLAGRSLLKRVRRLTIYLQLCPPDTVPVSIKSAPAPKCQKKCVTSLDKNQAQPQMASKNTSSSPQRTAESPAFQQRQCTLGRGPAAAFHRAVAASAVLFSFFTDGRPERTAALARGTVPRWASSRKPLRLGGCPGWDACWSTTRSAYPAS